MLVATLGLATLVASGCKSSAQHAPVKELTVPESIAAHKAGAVFVDANNEDFRKDNGKVPGAVLLANYRTYDVKSVLPEKKDTPLVFYCSNKR
jgi:rhodanese-related sulfurtransferase